MPWQLSQCTYLLLLLFNFSSYMQLRYAIFKQLLLTTLQTKMSFMILPNEQALFLRTHQVNQRIFPSCNSGIRLRLC